MTPFVIGYLAAGVLVIAVPCGIHIFRLFVRKPLLRTVALIAQVLAGAFAVLATIRFIDFSMIEPGGFPANAIVTYWAAVAILIVVTGLVQLYVARRRKKTPTLDGPNCVER